MKKPVFLVYDKAGWVGHAFHATTADDAIEEFNASELATVNDQRRARYGKGAVIITPAVRAVRIDYSKLAKLRKKKS